MNGLSDLLSASGPLARAIPGFSVREAQQQMAAAVGEALNDAAVLAVEAGTGTGKTYAYLVPALMSGQRVVISTGTKTLQDQLFHRDLPRVREALDVPARVSLLKGRANYLCLYRMKRAQALPGLGFIAERLREIAEWAQTTVSGDLGELSSFEDGDPLPRQITSTADNCLGSKCADFNACFVAKARRAAQAADLVVINHHLLFSDFVLKEEGFGQILSGADALIVDEAHQLPELAAAFFGLRLSTRQLADLAKDVRSEADALGDIEAVKEGAEALAARVALLETAFAQMPNRVTLADFLARRAVQEAVSQARRALDELLELLKPYEERNAELAACVERSAQMQTRWAAILDDEAESRVRWVEATGRGGGFHATPIEVADGFARMRAAYPGAWIFTSATLATGADFSHFTQQLGLQDARCLRLDSPFDYREQARLYLPKGLPEPNDPRYADAVADCALPLIEASGGGVFVLCTSHRALRQIAGRLRAVLTLKVLVQGEGSRGDLLRQFAEDGNAVLVGTSSFWEGVDVKGRALRVVLIDRLPFAAPGDPVFEARLEAIRRRGGSPFGEHQLPQAIMGLRQGAGRLIRDAADRGLLVLCDPRLRSKGYGRKVLASLPPMPMLQEWAEARDWLQTLA